MEDIIFDQSNVQLNVEAASWKEAISKGIAMLEKNGFVTNKYYDAIINDVKKYGSYMLIHPGIAIPHTRPENGALGVGFSLITLKKPVYFPDDDTPVKVMICFSSIDNKKHLEILKMIVSFIEAGMIDKIATLTEVEDLNTLFKEVKM